MPSAGEGSRSVWAGHELFSEAQQVSVFPPHPRAGIALMGYMWVNGWYTAVTETNILRRPTRHNKTCYT